MLLRKVHLNNTHDIDVSYKIKSFKFKKNLRLLLMRRSSFLSIISVNVAFTTPLNLNKSDEWLYISLATDQRKRM